MAREPAPASDDYRRGYQKGYAAGTRDRGDREWSAYRAAAQASKRAERAEAGQGLGRCDGCRWYQPEDGCKWGWCGRPWRVDSATADPDMIRPVFARVDGPGRLMVTSSFGCVLWTAPDG